MILSVFVALAALWDINFPLRHKEHKGDQKNYAFNVTVLQCRLHL
jgi:hypothetical protein